MCDLYYAKCNACDNGVDMHLGDYATHRDEVLVFCGQHCDLSGKPEYGWRTEFTWVGDDGENHDASVVALTENAKANWDGNHPNESADLIFRHFEDGKMVSEGRL